MSFACSGRWGSGRGSQIIPTQTVWVGLFKGFVAGNMREIFQVAVSKGQVAPSRLGLVWI